MKYINRVLLLVLVLVAAVPAQALTQWSINGRSYQVDTLIYPHPAGPGVTLSKFDLPELPLKVSVMEVDLKNPYIDFETCLGSEKAVGTETPPSMIARNTRPGHDVVGACNGDFYMTAPPAEVGMPRSGQLRRNEVVVNPVGAACFLLDDQKRPYIDRVDFYAQATHGATSFRVHTVNMLRLEYENTGGNQTFLFTNSYGPNTYACTHGKLVLIAPKQGSFAWAPNSSETCVVEAVVDPAGAIPIPEGKAYMWMQGNNVDYANAMNPGDELTISLTVNMRSHSVAGINLKEMIGGSNTIIMRNGQFAEGWEERHPRTMIGFTQDSTRMFIVVVDGRNLKSVGVTMTEAFGIFTELGCYNAVNLDGGGSTCMVANDEVINTPSDGPIRSVGNGCLLISNAPIDEQVSILNFAPRSYNVPTAAMITPCVWGYNQYGLLKSRDVKGCTFTCDPAIGTIDANGNFTAALTPAVGYIYATMGEVSTRQLVTVNATEMALRSESVVIDKAHPYLIQVLGVSGESSDLVNPAVIQWESEDSGICTVSEAGIVSAVADGTARIFGASENFRDTLVVNVQNPKARITCVENAPIDPATWAVTQSGGKNRTVTALDNGLKIDFTGSSTRSAYIKLAKKLDLWGIPDTICVRYCSNGLEIKRLTLSASVNGGNQVISDITECDTIGDMCVAKLATASWCDATDLANFPLNFVYLYFLTANPTAGVQYSLEVPGIELIYDYDDGSSLTGDVDGNGVIDVADANVIINIVLGKSARAGYNADVNADGIIDVTDINALINIILGK